MIGRRARIATVAGASAALLAGVAAFGVTAWADRRMPPTDTVAAATGRWAGPERIVFRNTAPGDGYGHVASVALSTPSGARSVSGEVCDRLYAGNGILSCLRTVRGVVPTFTATATSADGRELAAWALPGAPSRTRISPSGQWIATTAFVTGHSYASTGFSTATEITGRDGSALGNLEEWTLRRDGRTVHAADRNFWGVTFADDATFYATAGMTLTGETLLVRGDTQSRTLTVIADGIECPSLSPDGTRIAFKRVTGEGAGAPHWTPAVYDLASADVRLLPEPRSVDDQIEWLDDDTVLYGMPRLDAVGDGDVWAVDTDGGGDPRVLIEHASSPAVVRGGSAG